MIDNVECTWSIILIYNIDHICFGFTSGVPHSYILQLCNIYHVLLGFDAVDCV